MSHVLRFLPPDFSQNFSRKLYITTRNSLRSMLHSTTSQLQYMGWRSEFFQVQRHLYMEKAIRRKSSPVWGESSEFSQVPEPTGKHGIFSKSQSLYGEIQIQYRGEARDFSKFQVIYIYITRKLGIFPSPRAYMRGRAWTVSKSHEHFLWRHQQERGGARKFSFYGRGPGFRRDVKHVKSNEKYDKNKQKREFNLILRDNLNRKRIVIYEVVALERQLLQFYEKKNSIRNTMKKVRPST